MPVDYAIPNALQNPTINIAPPPVTTGSIVLVRQPVSSPPPSTSPPTPQPQTVRNLPGSPAAQTVQDVQKYQTIDLRFDNKSGTYSTRPVTVQNNQTSRIANNGAYGLAGVTGGTRSYAQDEAIAQLAYHMGYFISGAWTSGVEGMRYKPGSNRWYTPSEDAAFTAGNFFGSGLRELLKKTRDSITRTRDDTWRNRPQFKIPEFKIDFKLPKFPQIELPKLPEFKFPELPKPWQPQPQPQPRDTKTPEPKQRRFRLPDVCMCSSIATFAFVYYEVVTQRPDGSLSGVYVTNGDARSVIDNGIFRQDRTFVLRPQPLPPTFYASTFEDWTEEKGMIFNSISYPPGQPWLQRTSYSISIPLSKKDGENGYIDLELPALKRRVDSGSRNPWEINFIECIGCPKQKPQEEPPPPPDKCCMCCNDGNNSKQSIDYARIKRIMSDTLKEQKFTIDVPVCKCELNEQAQEWEPKISDIQLVFFATSKEQAEALAQLHFENAKQYAELCLARNNSGDEAIAAIPLSWQIRHEGGKPQMVIQCAEQYKDADGKIRYKSAMYPITVPHWKGKITDKPKLPTYKKGNWEGIYVLADNSKVTINAASEAECIKILNAIKPWIPKEMKEGAYFKGGKIDAEIKNTVVKPMYGRYFSTGQKNNKPDWRVDFP